MLRFRAPEATQKSEAGESRMPLSVNGLPARYKLLLVLLILGQGYRFVTRDALAPVY
jgi:hypothetical protein